MHRAQPRGRQSGEHRESALHCLHAVLKSRPHERGILLRVLPQLTAGLVNRIRGSVGETCARGRIQGGDRVRDLTVIKWFRRLCPGYEVVEAPRVDGWAPGNHMSSQDATQVDDWGAQCHRAGAVLL